MNEKPKRNPQGRFESKNRTTSKNSQENDQVPIDRLLENVVSNQQWRKIINKAMRQAARGDGRAREFLINFAETFKTKTAIEIQDESLAKLIQQINRS